MSQRAENRLDIKELTPAFDLENFSKSSRAFSENLGLSSQSN